MASDNFFTFLFLGPRPSLAASWPAPLVCDVVKRSRKRIKKSKSQSCRVTTGNGETSNGTPLSGIDFGKSVGIGIGFLLKMSVFGRDWDRFRD
jgi:hypothetical protein